MVKRRKHRFRHSTRCHFMAQAFFASLDLIVRLLDPRSQPTLPTAFAVTQVSFVRPPMQPNPAEELHV
jgi:hypothetical protein